jgi:hypothetical protein
LAGYGDESKIPDGGAVGLRIAIDNDYAFAAFGSSIGVRKPNDPGADHCKVINACSRVVGHSNAPSSGNLDALTAAARLANAQESRLRRQYRRCASALPQGRS